jgi:hypothetical protein
MRKLRDPSDFFGAILARWPVHPILGWAFLGRLYHRVGGVDLRYCFEDFPLALKFALATTPRLTEAVVYNYRVLDSSLSRSSSHRMYEDWARATLEQWRRRPVLALKNAARRFALAGEKALGAGRSRDAIRLAASAFACWPAPRRFFLLGRALLGPLRRADGRGTT